MTTQNNRLPESDTEQQKPSSEIGEAVQISLPKNNEIQTGPFEHSGETSRQTEEARKEEEEQKGE